jgi:hypothetical protein
VNQKTGGWWIPAKVEESHNLDFEVAGVKFQTGERMPLRIRFLLALPAHLLYTCSVKTRPSKWPCYIGCVFSFTQTGDLFLLSQMIIIKTNIVRV